MSLSRAQENLLELLVNVKQFLDDNGIKFYLFGGSCIGALRHHGFIPWDDDIDIIMDRDNYEKLIKASYDMPRDDMEFWCFEKSEDYFKPFGQFSSKKDTYFLKTRVFNRGLCMGSIIDVFVLDYVPSEKLEEHKKNLVLFEELMGFYRLHRDEIAEYKDEYFALVERERKEGRGNVIRELQRKVEQFNEKESDMLVTRFWVKKLRCYKKEWFGEPRYCEFEGHMMPIPANAEATLRLQYGYDWNRVPQEEQRYAHSFYANHDISNNNYVEDMEKFIDTSNIPELLEGRKHYQVERLAAHIELEKIGRELLLQRLLLENNAAIKNQEFERLDSIIENINQIKGSELAENVGELFLLNWMQWLIEEGRFYHAMKIMDSINKERENDALRDIQELLNQIARLVCAYQDNDLKSLENTLKTIKNNTVKNIPDVLLAQAKLAISKKEDNHILEKLISENYDYLKNHPHNYDVMKAQADLLKQTGKIHESRELYDIVIKNSKNGLNLLELSQSL